MAPPEQDQQNLEVGNSVGQDISRTSSAPNLTTVAPAEQDADADVVMPLVSDLAHRPGGGYEGQHSHNHSKTSAYVGESSRHDGSSAINVTTSGSYLSHDQAAANNYFSAGPLRSPSSRKSLRSTNPPSGQSSSGSLHTLAEKEGSEASASVRRALSSRSVHGGTTSSRRHSRSSSTSHTLVKRTLNNEHPVYPDQSFMALQSQIHGGGGRPYPILRSRSSNPSQRTVYTDLTTPASVSRDRLILPTASRTADNTPMTSPGLFSPQATRYVSPLSGENRSGSPTLHHLQAPKETHAAEIDHDLMTGNKIINTYEVIKELGRGEHGKVKLGRDMEHENYVAIKIVPRYSKHRRLGRLGEPQDQTKREVAILKKARHPNVVSLLEVIDDPNKNKVYLVLEYVDIGEIKWRRPGVQAITNINNKRFESERKGISLTLEPTEGDLYLVKLAAMRHEALEKSRAHAQQAVSYAHYSFEHESEDSDFLERSISQQFLGESGTPSRTHSQDDYVGTGTSSLAGSMYGAYDDQAHRPGRKHSVATAFSAVSHMSSEPEFDYEDEQFSYVPALTQDEARRAFRDTLCGLEFLHSIGIIHRDIKPSNLLVGSGDIVKISDFGVSYLGRPTTDEEAESKTFEAEGNPIDDEKELARSVGTPAFWAPELCYEDASIFADNGTPKITGALDLWALGITLYCMIYARLPFYADAHMGLHEAVCTSDVCCPKTRLVAADTTSPTFVTEPRGTMNSNKRVDYDLKFEVVPDTLRDLIRKLLTKDPAKRITIAEAKRHPWVIEGIPDYNQWIKPNENTKGSKKILEVNEKEMTHAVVKRSIIERTLTAAGRLAGSLLGRKDTRKRASSTATSASTSSESVNTPSGSSASTVGKQDRPKETPRTSFRGDEVLQALHKSRENTEHPLAQSQTASPDTNELQDYFANESTIQKTVSPEEDFDTQREARPKGPDRAISGVSTAESARTLRAVPGDKQPAADRSKEAEPSLLSEAYLRSRVEGLWEGTARAMYRLTSRDRRMASTSRSPSTSRHSSDTDARALPSLALTTTNVSGAIEAPESLSNTEPPSTASSTASSQPLSPELPHHTYHQPVTSSPAVFEQAQAINQRRHILESQQHTEQDTAAAQDQGEPNQEDCPPSPDDITFQTRAAPLPKPADAGQATSNMQSAPSASTIASSVDDHGNSSVSHSQSNPSFGTASGASSPPGDSFLSAEYKHLQDAQTSTTHTAETEPEFMRTADTITEHGRPKPAIATGKPLEQHDEIYDDGDDENDSSDEEVMMMGGPKKTLT